MDNPQKILVIQLKRAGDVIVTTPVLKALRTAFPQASIDFLVDKPFAPLLKNNPNLNRIQLFDRDSLWSTWKRLRAASYDWVLDFQSSPRSILAGLYSGARVRAGYRVSFWGKFFTHAMKRPGSDVSVTEGKMNLLRMLLSSSVTAGERQIFLTDSERQWAKAQMGEAKPAGRIVGLIPTHRRSSRRWHADSFVELGRQLSSKGDSVWLFWGPGEEAYVADVQRRLPASQMIPKTSLRQMAALLERCKIVVTNDNGPMHLAVAVGTPTVTVYGPTDPVSWNPGGPQHRVVRAEGLSCLGCNLNTCPFGHECMTYVTPEAVGVLCQ